MADDEHEASSVRVLREKRIALFIDEMRNIDDGERIRALNPQSRAGRKTTQRFARPQRRQRAFQAAEIERARLVLRHREE